MPCEQRPAAYGKVIFTLGFYSQNPLDRLNRILKVFLFLLSWKFWHFHIYFSKQSSHSPLWHIIWNISNIILNQIFIIKGILSYKPGMELIKNFSFLHKPLMLFLILPFFSPRKRFIMIEGNIISNHIIIAYFQQGDT